MKTFIKPNLKKTNQLKSKIKTKLKFNNKYLLTMIIDLSFKSIKKTIYQLFKIMKTSNNWKS